MNEPGFTKASSSILMDDKKAKRTFKVKKSISLLPFTIPPPSTSRLKRFLTVESNIILVPTPDENPHLQDI